MKKILIIVENLPVPFDRRVWQEATTLRDAGYCVSVICPIGKGHNLRQEILDGVHIFRHPMPKEGSDGLGYAVEYSAALFWEFLLTWRVLFTRGFDVIQACNPPDLIVLIAGFFKLFGKKFVFDHHDLNPELYEVKFRRRDGFYRALRFFEKMTFRVADAVISTNESYKRIAVERGGVAAENVYVVRSGPNLENFKSVAVSQRTESAEQNLVTVGYVGIMGDQDGIDGLLRVAHDIVIRRGRKDIQFFLIGDGTEFETLKAQAEELGIAESVVFAGYLRGSKLIGALAAIDIGAAPDEKNDYNDKCTMNKVMEYMAMGKPLVQYDLTEGRFSAQDAALYARDESHFADLILQLADDAELRGELGSYGKQRIENVLDWQFEVPNLLAAYDAVIGPRRRHLVNCQGEKAKGE